MAKALFVVLAALLAAVSCGSGKEEAAVREMSAPSEIVNAAYAHLVRAEYTEYLKCVQAYDSVSRQYRSGLVNVLRQWADNERTARKGMVRANATSEERNPEDTYALVRVDVVYGDSTKEEIVVQTVKTNGKWRLK